MYIDEDASTSDVVDTTVRALKESARHIGKADWGVSAGQIARVEDAIATLQNALDIKKRANNASRS